MAINNKPCSKNDRLSKATFLAMLPDGSRQKEFYLNIPNDRWDIVNFDPDTREACIVLTTLYGGKNLVGNKLNHLIPKI
jgi:hypothetical protein